MTLSVGVLWWWAVLRLALAPAEAGPLEGAVAVGGWGLGLLPVHCVPGPAGAGRRAGVHGGGGGPGGEVAGRESVGGESVGGVSAAGESVGGVSAGGEAAAVESVSGGTATRASRLHRSGEGSGPS
ncbi:hypothetical protein OG904_06240 [Streptomyces sp. NBC_00096]